MTLDRMLATAALLEQDGSFRHKKLLDAASTVSHLLQDFYTDGADQRLSVHDYASYWLSSGRGSLEASKEGL